MALAPHVVEDQQVLVPRERHGQEARDGLQVGGGGGGEVAPLAGRGDDWVHGLDQRGEAEAGGHGDPDPGVEHLVVGPPVVERQLRQRRLAEAADADDGDDGDAVVVARRVEDQPHEPLLVRAPPHRLGLVDHGDGLAHGWDGGELPRRGRAGVGAQGEPVLGCGDGAQLAPEGPQPVRHGERARREAAAHGAVAPALAAAEVGVAGVEEVVDVVGDVPEPAEPVADGGVGEHGADGGELGLHGREFRPEGTEERALVPDGGAEHGQHLPHDGRGESTLRHGCALECLSLSLSQLAQITMDWKVKLGGRS